MRHRSNTLPVSPDEHDDPFYAPTNLATRLRSNPQPRSRPAPPAVDTPDLEDLLLTNGPPGTDFAGSKKGSGSVPARPNHPHPRGGHAPHSPTDSLAMILLGLVVVLLLALRGASSGSVALAAENARLVEERGQFVVSLMDWSQRLLEAE